MIDIERFDCKLSARPDTPQRLATLQKTLGYSPRESGIPCRIEPSERCLDFTGIGQAAHTLAISPNQPYPFPDEHRLDPSVKPLKRAPDRARNGKTVSLLPTSALEGV